jgi:hypothetical protein
LAREDAGSASNTMLSIDFVPFLHNLYYLVFVLNPAIHNGGAYAL